jgi:rhodanese-related sulfurtransferase
MKDHMITILKKSLFLLVLAVVVALVVNRFSPVGIALIGHWDKDVGATSANANKEVHDSLFEIDDIELAKSAYDGGTVLFVDARSIDAYDEGHIKGAVSLPVEEFDAMVESFLDLYPADQFIITYCSGRNCEDSHILAQMLIDIGYESVSIMIDGFPGWKENGFPIEKYG